MFVCSHCDSKVKKIYDAGFGYVVCGKCRKQIIDQAERFRLIESLEEKAKGPKINN